MAENADRLLNTCTGPQYSPKPGYSSHWKNLAKAGVATATNFLGRARHIEPLYQETALVLKCEDIVSRLLDTVMHRRTFIATTSATLAATLTQTRQSPGQSRHDIRLSHPSSYAALSVAASNKPDFASEAYKRFLAKKGYPLLDPKAETEFLARRFHAYVQLYKARQNGIETLSGDEWKQIGALLTGEEDIFANPNTPVEYSNYLYEVRANSLNPFPEMSTEQRGDIAGLSLGLAGIFASPIYPALGTGLSIASLAAPYVANVRPEVRDAMRETDIFAMRHEIGHLNLGAISDAIDGHLRAAGVKLDHPDILIYDLPIPFQDQTDINIRKIAGGRSLSNELEIREYFERTYKSISELQQKFIANTKKLEAETRDSRNARLLAYREVEAGGFLASHFLEALGADPDTVTFLRVSTSQTAKVMRLVDGFAADPPTVGALALTSGGLGALLAIQSALDNSGARFNASLATAIAAIQRSIATLRREMHDRFDRIESNQQAIIEQLDFIATAVIDGKIEQLGMLSEIKERLNGTLNFVASQERSKRLSTFENNISIIRTKIQSSGISDAIKSDLAVSTINSIVTHATNVSKEEAFTRNDIISWNAPQIQGAVESGSRLDHLSGFSRALCRGLQIDCRKDSAVNFIEWVRGVNAFVELFSASAEPLPLAYHSHARRLHSTGVQLQSQIKSLSLPELRSSARKRYLKEFEVVEKLIKTHYDRFTKENSIPRLVVRKILDTQRSFSASTHVPAPVNGFPEGRQGLVFDVKVLKFPGIGIGAPEDSAGRQIVISKNENPIEIGLSYGVIKFVEKHRFRLQERYRYTTVVGSLRFLIGDRKDKEYSLGYAIPVGKSNVRIWMLPSNYLTNSFPELTVKPDRLFQELWKLIDDRHDQLKRAFFDSFNGFLSDKTTQLGELAAIGSGIRHIAAMWALCDGASLSEATQLANSEEVTYSSVNSVNALVAGDLRDELSMDPDDVSSDTVLYEWLASRSKQVVDKQISRLLFMKDGEFPDRELQLQVVDGTLQKLAGLAFHHGFSLIE